jgi:WD40 repeat protein
VILLLHSRVIEGHSEAVSAAAFSPDSKLLVTGDLVGSMRIWSVQSSTKACGIQTVESAHDMGVQACDFSAGKCSDNGNFF